ncbi:uncharacterized protein LOC130645452 [Hydractinia symbiolongicarpus]|uniref:uncharacterized protein LOC130645452 n=1 Tax=Hydractinia symbiolongicarpus TaxID=13093 RepID=UPI00254DB808|nr:uncharacterized protein LOC130645452 [Hydractinia symbiolongicarpus]
MEVTSNESTDSINIEKLIDNLEKNPMDFTEQSMSPTLVNTANFISSTDKIINKKLLESEKRELKLEILKDVCEIINGKNEVLIDHVLKEIQFLREQLSSKDEILRLFLKNTDENYITKNAQTPSQNNITVATESKTFKNVKLTTYDNTKETINQPLSVDISTQKKDNDRPTLVNSNDQLGDANITTRKKNQKNVNDVKKSTHDEHRNLDLNITSNERKQIIVVGDSIVKHIRPYGISKSDSVRIRCQLGATTEDIVDHVKPYSRKLFRMQLLFTLEPMILRTGLAQ